MTAALFAQVVQTRTGEEQFFFGWKELAVLVAVLIVYLILVFANKLPSMSAFKEFADVINTAGGQIVVLGLFSWWSIKIAMQYFYHILAIQSDAITKQDAIIMAGVTFVTGTLVGTFTGALLKTMSGGKAVNGATQPDKLNVAFTPTDKSR